MIHNRRSHRRFRNPANALARSCAALLESLEPRQHLTVTGLTRASVATDGTPATTQSGYGVISADANWVAFQSTATNLVTGDANGFTDVFLRDLRNNTTIRISLPALGGGTGDEGDQNSTDPAISADGRYVAFLSNASNLVPNDTNDAPDVFLYDRLGNGGAGTITRISVDSDEVEADSSSSPPSISADGRYIVFHSNAANLVANDTNEASDIFLRDTLDGTTVLISKNPGGGSQGNAASYNPAISADGSAIAFISNASNFVAAGGDSNNVADVFVFDRDGGTLERVSIKSGLDTAANQANGAAGQRVALSSDGNYVVFESNATNLVSAADANGKTDIFLRFRSGDSSTTTRISQTNAAVVGNGESTFASINSTGRYIIYESTSTNLASGDTTVGRYHVYMYDRIANTTRRVSVSAAGTVANDDSRYPSLSSDGQYSAFFSKASNLIELDNNGVGDIFANVAPRGAVTGTPDGLNPQQITSGDTSPQGNDGTDFGHLDIANGSPIDRTFTITNNGTAPLVLSGTSFVTLTGTNASEFSILTQPASGTIAVGASVTFTVRFDPSTPGVRVAKVNFASNDPTTPTYTFDISGTGLDLSNVSRLRVTQGNTLVGDDTPLAIGNVARSSTSTVYTFAITNVSAEVLTLAQLTLNPNSGFEIESPIGSLLLAPGQTTTFAIRIPANSAAGAKSTTINLSNTDSATPPVTRDISIDVTATVILSKFTLLQNGSALASGSTVAFGNVVKGSSSISKTFAIRNDGQAPLILGTITPPAGYSVTTAPPSTIAPGANATLTITLSSSTAAGAKNGVFTIVTNDPSVGTFTLNLTGAVTAPSISVTFNGSAFASNSTVAFGSASTGQTVPTRSIVVTNTGTANLNLGSITVPSGFSIVGSTAAQVLGPGGTATITFRLATSSLGAKSGDLSFSTNAEGVGSFKVKLTGTVNSQPLTLFIDGVAATGQSVPFGTLGQGNTSVKKTLTIRNDGAITLNLGDVDVPAGFTRSSNLSATKLAPGESASFSVSLTPRTSGALSGVLSIPTDEANREKYVLGLTANVTAAAKTGLGVATVTLSKLPNPVLGGTSAAVGSATVTLQNYSAATVAGSYKITLYMSEGPFNEPVDKVLGTLNVKLNLAKNAKSSHGVNLKFPAPAVDGKYNVVAVVTGAKADPVYSTGRAPFTVQVEKAQAKIGQSGIAAKLNSKLGQKVTQSVTLSNSGNSAIVGTTTGVVYLSKDGTIENATKVGNVSGLKINLAKSKGTQKLSFSATLPKKLPAGYGAKGTYTLLLKITKIASSTASTLVNDGVINAGKIKLT